MGRLRDAQFDRERIARGFPRRIALFYEKKTAERGAYGWPSSLYDLVAAFLLTTRLPFGIEPVRLAYTFAYTRLPARQIVPVTVVTKNANAIPIFLFVC